MQIERYTKVQNITKNVHKALVDFITPEATESTIVQSACKLLEGYGVVETWYHDVPAFVLLGSRSCLSISGRDYTPFDEPVGEYNLVTVDLSPMIGNVWGDCARSFYIQNGVCSLTPKSTEFREGRYTETTLHEEMMRFVTPETKFSELYEFGNALIEKANYENLDFLGNLGHSIETDPSKRYFIDKNCHDKLGSVDFFTFEPHIKSRDGQWGFKHENIYYFDSEHTLNEL